MADFTPIVSSGEYSLKLGKRKKESRAHRVYQFIGLEIAQILGDLRHKGLYMRLAKERDPHILMELAKEISQRDHVKNKGAYFMARLTQLKIPIINSSRKSNMRRIPSRVGQNISKSRIKIKNR